MACCEPKARGTERGKGRWELTPVVWKGRAFDAPPWVEGADADAECKGLGEDERRVQSVCMCNKCLGTCTYLPLDPQLGEDLCTTTSDETEAFRRSSHFHQTSRTEGGF